MIILPDEYCAAAPKVLCIPSKPSPLCDSVRLTVMTTPEELAQQLFPAAQQVLAANSYDYPLTEAEVTVERPKSREHGDWATNLAMRLAKPLGTNPRQLAEQFATAFAALDGVSSAEVAGPGFINIVLEAGAAGLLVKQIVEAGESFGQNDAAAGQSVNLEFVSANPTGPLHLAHTRWAALGDSLARLLRVSGAEVASEYYINDAGAQIDNFANSVIAAMRGEPTPEGGYPGEYIGALAQFVLGEVPDLLSRSDEEILQQTKKLALAQQLKEIRESLDNFRVKFDTWFSEQTLHEKNPETGTSAIDDAVERLRELGMIFEADDAIWVRTTEYGDDKDRVIRRGNGIYTYFAADAAYYLSKKDRGFAEKVYLLGADHHGYVHRLKALAGTAGDDPEKNITVLIGQTVTVNGARLSKRAGNIVELDDLMEWLGTDSLRYWLARYPADSPLDLEGEKLKSQSNDNPVFYVQYAHARTSAVARNAAAAGVTRENFDAALLDHETESDLIGTLAGFERTLRHAAQLREPHRVARYLEELAAKYHRWYDSCRVIPQGEEPVTPTHQSRLWLNDATAIVLRNGLELLGVSAPERM